MVIGSMATAQGSGITCPHSISSRLQQAVVVSRNGSSQPVSVGFTLRFARPSHSTGGIINLQAGLSSSFCMPGGVRAGVKGLTTLGNLWQRRLCEGRRVRCQLGGASSSEEDEIGTDENVASTLGENDTVQFNLNFPRRSVLVEFTCNVCQARTQRMVNPSALRRGTVYVQCGGCEVYHQLVDNLNLVEEYDFKDKVDPMMSDLGI